MLVGSEVMMVASGDTRGYGIGKPRAIAVDFQKLAVGTTIMMRSCLFLKCLAWGMGRDHRNQGGSWAAFGQRGALLPFSLAFYGASTVVHPVENCSSIRVSPTRRPEVWFQELLYCIAQRILEAHLTVAARACTA